MTGEARVLACTKAAHEACRIWRVATGNVMEMFSERVWEALPEKERRALHQRVEAVLHGQAVTGGRPEEQRLLVGVCRAMAEALGLPHNLGE